MTPRELTDFLTQTGPDTPMDGLLRRYWIPALLSSELPEADCPPVRVKLLSERLIAFRDTQGRLGLIDEFCAPSVASPCGSVATRRWTCAAPITAGSTTSPANASMFLPSGRRTDFAKGSG
jgi:hypothetical protein